MTCLINPVIEPLGEEQTLGWEACLSVPGLTGVVPRWSQHPLSRPRPRRPARSSARPTDFHARVVQHECDHLDGILYPMRMDDLSLLAFADELRHGLPLAAAGEPDED